MKLQGAVAVVTGGASGLGAATVRAFFERGARVVILGRPSSRGEAIAHELGAAARFVPTDVTSPDQVAQAMQQTVAAFGALHIVVNCAAVGPVKKIVGRHGPMPLELFDAVVRVNLSGTFNVIRLAVAEMLRNTPNDDGERGVIINTASLAAFEGQPGTVAYAASKAGVAGMTLPIARELAGDGIRCVSIAPGTFNTPLLAMMPEPQRTEFVAQIPFPSRPGRPSEYAALACHIVENPMLNGSTIRLDAALRLPAK